MSLAHLLYVSDASETMDNAALEAMLGPCRSKNRRLGVSGVLFYSAGHFIQLLEGEEAVIESLFETIRRDPRHHHVEKLVAEPTNRRIFADWDMGLLNMDNRQPLDRHELSEIIDEVRRIQQENSRPESAGPVELLSKFCMMLPRRSTN
ncbi:MAG: BLUF domain-containing protein [Myxococcota bacterium]